MQTKTYRAKSIQEALELVRHELGPDAAVLHTREVRGGLLGRMIGGRQIEVTASSEVNVPSRYANEVVTPTATETTSPQRTFHDAGSATERIAPAHEEDYRAKFRNDLQGQLSGLHSMLENLCHKPGLSRGNELPESLFHLFTDLIDAELTEDLARELIDKVRAGASSGDLNDPVLMKARITRLVEAEINVRGPIRVTPGSRKLVALVGPTGVGKTTTIAKLAANFRLRDQHNVGLITVDTYRVAAVEQLRTYADIIDLPMEVVSTPSEMRQAVERLSHLDLILLDTAGRSPRDEVQLQELKSMLAEAQPDETHLVLSSVTSTPALKKTAERFADVGLDALVLTKLDEATGLGNLVPLLRSCKLPLSYVTNGQNVPDDIDHADSRSLAHTVLGIDQRDPYKASIRLP
jgi:flagellar biosynthesis protein FlhF